MVPVATQAGTLGVWDWDVVHNRVTWTDSLFPIHGLKPGEFGGTMEAFAELVHRDDRQFVSAAIQAALNDGTPFEIEFRIQRRDGEVVWIFTNAKVLHENGRAIRVIGTTGETHKAPSSAPVRPRRREAGNRCYRSNWLWSQAAGGGRGLHQAQRGARLHC